MKIELLNTRIKHFNELSLREFFYTDMWSFFHKQAKSSMVIFPVKRTLSDTKFKVESTQINLGWLHFLYSDSLHVGYVIEFVKPYNIVKHSKFFVGYSQPVDWKYLYKNSKVEILLSNDYLAVSTYGEEVLMATKKELVHQVVLP